MKTDEVDLGRAALADASATIADRRRTIARAAKEFDTSLAARVMLPGYAYLLRDVQVRARLGRLVLMRYARLVRERGEDEASQPGRYESLVEKVGDPYAFEFKNINDAPPIGRQSG